MKTEQKGFTCDITLSPKNKSGRNLKSEILKFKDFNWGVRDEEYKKEKGSWELVKRNVLIGEKGEKTKFHLRYFEVKKGGYSSFEKHLHEHVVICIRGKGKVKLGSKTSIIKPFDVVYIAPDSPHQLLNPYEEPFGFLCIVDSERDRPKLL